MTNTALNRRLERLQPRRNADIGPDRIELVGIDPATGREVGEAVTIHVRP